MRLYKATVFGPNAGDHERGYHPLWHAFPDDLYHPTEGPTNSVFLTLQFVAAPGLHDFQFGLLRLHSQLLTQSLLFSFPPLSDMLKFGG